MIRGTSHPEVETNAEIIKKKRITGKHAKQLQGASSRELFESRFNLGLFGAITPRPAAGRSPRPKIYFPYRENKAGPGFGNWKFGSAQLRPIRRKFATLPPLGRGLHGLLTNPGLV
ncbi:hypothetical protein EVAR_55297_1 [Eumeta japonica]|uniref:Uncharacterized protein n=1 Tax=Eumeta variegata TaxID=151549 RepID=A0A4C1ZIN1_EUMVA|nr:hypothetical protein EVAR_55297_1 [Eumeta japonica]